MCLQCLCIQHSTAQHSTAQHTKFSNLTALCHASAYAVLNKQIAADVMLHVYDMQGFWIHDACQDPMQLACIVDVWNCLICRGQAAAFATFTNFGSNFAVSFLVQVRLRHGPNYVCCQPVLLVVARVGSVTLVAPRLLQHQDLPTCIAVVGSVLAITLMTTWPS